MKGEFFLGGEGGKRASHIEVILNFVWVFVVDTFSSNRVQGLNNENVCHTAMIMIILMNTMLYNDWQFQTKKLVNCQPQKLKSTPARVIS